jgi:hypothetical protein
VKYVDVKCLLKTAASVVLIAVKTAKHLMASAIIALVIYAELIQAYQVLRCRRCKEPKSIDDFYKNKMYKGGIDTTCKSCRSGSIKQAYHDNKDTPQVVDESSFKVGMTNSGYSPQEIKRVMDKIMRSQAGVKRNSDILDYVECRCGEKLKECYPCYLNRWRDRVSKKK